MLRGGVGSGSDGTHALVGIQFGNPVIQGSLTARRTFDSKDVIVSATIDVMTLLPALPFIALFAKD